MRCGKQKSQRPKGGETDENRCWGVVCVRVRLGLNVVCDYVFVTHMHYVSYNQTNFIIKILLITQKRSCTYTNKNNSSCCIDD